MLQLRGGHSLRGKLLKPIREQLSCRTSHSTQSAPTQDEKVPKKKPKSTNMATDVQLANGITMIIQGFSEITSALSKVQSSSATPTTTLGRIPEFTQNNPALSSVCIVLESLRQLFVASVEHKFKSDIDSVRVSEPLAPNEILVKSKTPLSESSIDFRQFDQISTKVPSLSAASKAKRVPASRFGRALTYGNLLAGLSFGAASETFQKILSSESKSTRILSEANANRIVETLCQVRGAALKIGQILSIQDTNLVPEQIQSLFLRVRDSAHYMPQWQLNRVMTREWGKDWREKLSTFEEMPFAAASIGQVHRGTYEDRKVAIKIQYPGVAQGINSDIDNLMMLLKIWDVIPKGFFIYNLVEVARRELAWEVDYAREAKASTKFQELLKDSQVFYVPDVITSLSTERVLVTELIEGAIPVDRLDGASQALRNYIAKNLLSLTLKEIFVYRFMQTDPNWSNFLYKPDTQKIILLDFGASRPYNKNFIDVYLQIIDAAIARDKETLIELSKKIGFLTGEETSLMKEAHCDATLLLAEAFTVDEFDFSQRETERKVSQLVPIMLKYRLTPPPEEIYSLHRKLSGMFLLCSKLKAKINCRELFFDIRDNYEFCDENREADDTQSAKQ